MLFEASIVLIPQHNKGYASDKPTVNIIVNGENVRQANQNHKIQNQLTKINHLSKYHSQKWERNNDTLSFKINSKKMKISKNKLIQKREESLQ